MGTSMSSESQAILTSSLTFLKNKTPLDNLYLFVCGVVSQVIGGQGTPKIMCNP